MRAREKHAALLIENYYKRYKEVGTVTPNSLTIGIESGDTVGPVLIARVRVRKLVLLLAHPYMQFAQTQLLNSQCKLKRDKHNN